ncbi:MAG: phosphate-starvation-inducible PsiE family protein [Gammaproteobacteria bacterium]|nr:phosphate-starvation-inducible PsiE family protein [Gammaproteobacteria bacterium]
MTKAKLSNKHPIMLIIRWVEWIGLSLITMGVILAIIQEVLLVIERGHVELYDILLLFIYLEVMAMVSLYLTSGKLPVRYPIYIAIVAIARYVILDLKELESIDVIWLGIAILILTLSTLVLRYGHAAFPYPDRVD